MAAAPPSARELDAYREQADRFIAELDEEAYLHYSGQKDTYELAPIYERHADLTTLEAAQSLGSAVDGTTGGVRELWRFACEGYLGERTKEHQERAAALEAGLVAEVDDEPIPFRMLRPSIANESDRERRRRLEEARNALVEQHLVPVQLEEHREAFAGARALGADSYLDLYRDRFGMAEAHRETVEAFGVEAVLLDVGESHVELLKPLSEESAVGRFLERNGPGMHHVAYQTDDIDSALDGVRAAGLRLIDEEPRTGIRNSRVAFLHPKSTLGVLTEIVEPAH